MFGINRDYFMTHRGQSNFGDDLYYKLLNTAAEEHGIKPRWLFTYNKNNLTKLFRLFLILIDGLRLILFAKRLTIVGGSISLLGSHKLLKAILFVHGMTKFKLSAYSVSFVNYVEHSEVYIRFISKFDYISVRDKMIYEFIMRNIGMSVYSLKCYFAPDLGFATAQYFSVTRDQIERICNKRIGISLCYYNSYINEDLSNYELYRTNLIFESLSNSLTKDDEIIIFVLNGDRLIGDEKITNLFLNHLINAGFHNIKIMHYKNNLEEIVDLISTLDRMISMRLHGYIVALSLGIPSLLVEYSHKGSDVYYSLNPEDDDNGIILIDDNYEKTEMKLTYFLDGSLIVTNKNLNIKVDINRSLVGFLKGDLHDC